MKNTHLPILLLITLTLQSQKSIIKNNCYLPQIKISSIFLLKNYKENFLTKISSFSLLNFQRKTLSNFEIVFKIKKKNKVFFLAFEFFKKNGKIVFEKFLQTPEFSDIKKFFIFKKKYAVNKCYENSLINLPTKKLLKKKNFLDQKKKNFEKNLKKKNFRNLKGKRFLKDFKSCHKHLKSHQHDLIKSLSSIYGFNLDRLKEHTRRHFLKNEFKKNFKGYDKKRRTGYGFQHTY